MVERRQGEQPENPNQEELEKYRREREREGESGRKGGERTGGKQSQRQ